VVRSVSDAIISKTLDGTVTGWNRAAERLFGYTADEAIGQSIDLIIPADRLDEATRIMECVRGGEHLDHHETIRRSRMAGCSTCHSASRRSGRLPARS